MAQQTVKNNCCEPVLSGVILEMWASYTKREVVVYVKVVIVI